MGCGKSAAWDKQEEEDRIHHAQIRCDRLKKYKKQELADLFDDMKNFIFDRYENHTMHLHEFRKMETLIDRINRKGK